MLQLRTHAGLCLPRGAGQGALVGAAGACYEAGWARSEDARGGSKDALARSRARVCAQSQGVNSGDGVVASSADARKACDVDVQTAAPLSEDALRVGVSLSVLQRSILAQTASRALKKLSMSWRPGCVRLLTGSGSGAASGNALRAKTLCFRWEAGPALEGAGAAGQRRRVHRADECGTLSASSMLERNGLTHALTGQRGWWRRTPFSSAEILHFGRCNELHGDAQQASKRSREVRQAQPVELVSCAEPRRVASAPSRAVCDVV